MHKDTYLDMGMLDLLWDTPYNELQIRETQDDSIFKCLQMGIHLSSAAHSTEWNGNSSIYP